MLEKNVVANSSYTIKADVCHFSFSNLSVYISVKKPEFVSLTNVISAENGFGKICTFRTAFHTHTHTQNS